MRPIHPNRILQVVCVCFVLSIEMNAQVLNKPVPADNPNLPGNSAWTAACASSDFNEYFVNFTWNPPLVNGDNEFILELSDGNGNFSSPTELARVSDQNTTFDFDFQFALPTDTRGEGYRMRVKSTSPALTSPSSDPYSMYYIDYNSPILISQDGSGSIPPGGTIHICDGNTIVLSPHNVANANTYQYNWYRSGTPLSEKSENLNVSTAGMYYVEIDYGATCSGSANTLSNTIEITTGTSQGLAINPPAKTALCPSETLTLQANISGSGFTYTWFKDGVAITSPTVDDDSYLIDAAIAGFEGDYQVEIDGAATCQEMSAAITITNAGDFTVTRDNEANIVLLPSQTKTLSVSTTAGTPDYQWYKDGSPIAGETANSLVINAIGTYFARVAESGGACASSPVDSETTTVVAPDSFEFIVDYVTSYTACSSTDVTLGLVQINAVGSSGARTDVTSDIEDSFAYQWEKDAVSVSGETSNTLIVTDNTDNGSYVLTGTVDSYNALSNALSVQLRSSETISIASNNGNVICQGANDIILSTPRDLSGDSFEWHRDGTDTGAANTTFTVTESGTYELVVMIDGCPVPSSPIVISDFDDSQLVLDNDTNIVFPEGESVTVRASGAANYQWFDSGNNLISNSDTNTFSEEGEYLLVAEIGDCQVSRVLTVEFQDTFRVPNVITTNGDGINDLWVLPNTYSRRSDVTVTVFNEKGQEIFNQNNYQNNWPESTTAFSQQNMVFYYKIKKENNTIKQGTITVIK